MQGESRVANESNALKANKVRCFVQSQQLANGHTLRTVASGLKFIGPTIIVAGLMTFVIPVVVLRRHRYYQPIHPQFLIRG